VSRPDLPEAQYAIVQDRLSGELLDAYPLPAGQLEEIVDAGTVPLGGERIPVTGVCGGPPGFVVVTVDTPGGQPSRFDGDVPLPPGRAAVSSREALGPFLLVLESVIEARQASTAERSYTRSLLDGGAEKIGRKLREEAGELGVALVEESDDRVANEAADVLFHLLVGLRHRGLRLRTVIEVLARRFGVSGHVEKASRGRQQ
jgi:phosphoribosyl-ATP pyrophosphohydrolase